MTYASHLYHILYPNHALVASQLSPQEFSHHYQLRSTPQDMGKLIFAEIDIGFRHDYFKIDEALREMKPHSDGSPKHTKFISCYRVLEHMDLDCIKKLYLVNPDGSILGLDRSEQQECEEEELKIFAEICPLSMLVLSRYSSQEFGDFVTDRQYERGAPKLFFLRLQFDIPAFLKKFEANPFMLVPITNLHPSKLRDAIQEMQANVQKPMKALCLTSSLDDISYKMIAPGFWFVSPEKKLFFEMPDFKTIETSSYKFWRAM